MGARERKIIADKLREMSQTTGFDIVQGEVDSVNENDFLIDVKITEGVVIHNVRLSSITQNKNGVIEIPKKGSYVVIARMEGGVDYVLLRANEITKWLLKIQNTTIEITDSEIKANGGNNKGMVKVVELTQKINNLENKVNELIGICKSMTVALAPSGTYTLGTAFFSAVQTLQTTNKGDIENTKFTH